MVLMLRKSESEHPQVAPIDVWARRSLALLAFGVVHFLFLMWPGEILWTLGVAALPLLAFRTARPRTLWIWALIIIACLSAHRACSTSGYVDSYQAALAGEMARSTGQALSSEQGLGLRLVDMWWQSRTGFEIDIHQLNPTMSLLRSAWYQPARLALTMAYVGFFALIWRAGWRVWMPPFRAMGRTALTVYTLQSILTSILFYALGYLGKFGAAGLLVAALCICIVTASFSIMWLKIRSMGPMEWLLRAIAYNTFSPARKPAAAEALGRTPSI